jgi:TIR domain
MNTITKDSSNSRRFAIALSFPGEHRDFVKLVADHLAAVFGKDRVLYDKYYEAEFARPDLDVYLPRLYRTQSELVVLFLCPEYAAKRWCNLEWRHIRQLIATVDASRIMLLRYGYSGDFEELGILPGDGTINFEGRAILAASPSSAPWTASAARVSNNSSPSASSPAPGCAVSPARTPATTARRAISMKLLKSPGAGRCRCSWRTFFCTGRGCLD